MKKKLLSLLLVAALCLGLLPVTAYAAETEPLPDWYFLFAIFKNVDADARDRNGNAAHAKYSMTQDEVDVARVYARDFEEYMNRLGIMRAHVDVVEIDAILSELDEYSGGSYIGQEQATPLLKNMIDLNRYDHVTCITSLGVDTEYGGIAAREFENGTGHSCINFTNQELCLNFWKNYPWRTGWPVHEYLHFMEQMNKRYGEEFNLHDIMENFYERVNGDFEECYTDILLNRAKGTAGTGVCPTAWQYTPCVIRTMRETACEVTISSDTSVIGDKAFQNFANLSKVYIHSGVTAIGNAAFERCTALTEITIPSNVTRIGEWAFQGCTALTRVSVPAGVTSIGYAAFWDTGIKDVYYAGTEAQWEAIQMGEFNENLTHATIHYNHLTVDVKTAD